MPDSHVPPHVFVIFGATGDLTKRKLLPAFYHLLQRREAGGHAFVLGTSRSDWSDDDFRKFAREALRETGFSDDDLRRWCDGRLFFHSLGPDGDNFEGLKARIEALEARFDLPGNRVFYLSLAPKVFPATVEALGETGLNRSDGWTRIVIEKPFGHDLDSARALNRHVHQHFDEHQVYRIDHYLGKETVQNLLVFRFANALFENAWNRDRVRQVEITVAEELGVGTRAGYYDKSGALRDMIQNHLTQLLTLVAMDVPSTFEADALRQEKVKVLHAVAPIRPEDAVFGQYGGGRVDGEAVPAYRDEEGVPDGSSTETYVALRLRVQNWRWQGVPFYLRTGKRLPQRCTQIAVHFHQAPVSIFQPYDDCCDVAPNILVITLQPNEGFDLRFEVKAPGEPFSLQPQTLTFRYEEAFGALPDAYETLLLDVVTGDQTLFVHADEVEAAWALYTPLLERAHDVHPYEAGTWGPEESRHLLDAWTTEG